MEWKRLSDYSRYEVNADGDVRSERGYLKEKDAARGSYFRMVGPDGRKHFFPRATIKRAYLAGSIEGIATLHVRLFDEGYTAIEIAEMLSLEANTVRVKLRESGRSPDKQMRAMRKEEAEKRKQRIREENAKAAAERKAQREAEKQRLREERDAELWAAGKVVQMQLPLGNTKRHKAPATFDHDEVHECPECGRLFTARLVAYERGKKIGRPPKYCSDACTSKASKKAYREAHQGEGRASKSRARRMTRASGAGYDPSVTLKRLIERDGLTCYICGVECSRDDKTERGGVGPTYPTLDHVIPLSKGGSHTWDNVKIACHRCNSLKGADITA